MVGRQSQNRTIGVVFIVVLVGALAFAIGSFVSFRAKAAGAESAAKSASAPATAASDVAMTTATALPAGARIVFRNTAAGSSYGLVASVPLGDPTGVRTVTKTACDRVDASRTFWMCLHTDRGTTTRFMATLFDASWAEVRSWPLPGVPSRTRLSPDSTLVGETAFVTHESYATTGFSTRTTISSTTGKSYGTLEDFKFMVDGTLNTAKDRNFWGVTFAKDDTTFYATAASDSKTWLVKGDLATRTLTAIRTWAECPSLSPDGTRVAYKKNRGTIATPKWTLAVSDLKTGRERTLPIPDNVDDQAEWLDDSTILFGLANPATPGDSTVWSIAADGSRAPTVFLEHAWSPAVVR